MTGHGEGGGSWPSWDQSRPEELTRYVIPEEVAAHCPGLPGPDDGDELRRLRSVYEVFAAAGARFAHERYTAQVGHQQIRPPDQVFRAPRHANCLDAAVAFAGACMYAGLHPLLLILDAATPGGAGHVVAAVWVKGSRAQHAAPDYPRNSAIFTRDDLPDVRHAVDRPSAFVAVDPSAGLRGSDRRLVPFEAAVAAGAEALRGDAWRFRLGVDVGLVHQADREYVPPYWPGWAPSGKPPLTPPYADIEQLPEADRRSVRVLRAEYGVVPFLDRDELDALQGWCLEPASAGEFGVAVVTGVGGAGKTRLALELAARLARDGWYTGLAPPLDREDDQTALAAWLATIVGPLLVVVDYAEARTTLVSVLLNALRGRDAWPARLVLTSRSLGEWVKEVDRALIDGRHHRRPWPIELRPSHPEPARIFRRALRRLTELSGTAPAVEPPLRRLERRRDWTTLDYVMLAWLAARGDERKHEDRNALYEEVLDHERRYWARTHAGRGGTGWSERLFNQAAACLTLTEPTVERAPELLRAVGDMEGDGKGRGDVADSLSRCLSSHDGRVSVKPDPIADHLMLDRFASDLDGTPPGRWPLVVRCVEQGNEAERMVAIVNLSRAAGLDRERAARLAAALVCSVPGLWKPALQWASLVGGPFVDGLCAYVEMPATKLPLPQLAERVPLGHAHLRPLAEAAAARLVRDQEIAGDPAETARLLNNWAQRLAEVGRRQDALDAITKAVAHYRQLADAYPDAFLPELAASLTNLANELFGVGRRQDALDAVIDAVATRRQLADADPGGFLPDLATSLNNLAAMLSGVGRHRDAQEAVTEAVAIRRQLADADPGAFLPDLAASLNNLALMLSRVGCRQDALHAVTEAVAIRRRLAAANPAAFLPDLARSLHNQAKVLSEVGRRQDALHSVTEAVTIRRPLADANPGAFLPDLAGALINQANTLFGVGRRQDALDAITEAVDHYRQLVGANPDAFVPSLAMSLNSQATMLSGVGQRQDALDAITEAVGHYRQLADANPGAYLTDLARSLHTQATMLSGVGRRQDALDAINEAVAQYRQLAEANPDAFVPDLAMSLNSHANRLTEVGRRQDSLDAIIEAVALYRQLADADPGAFLLHLAASLNNLANGLSGVGRRQGALDAITEAVSIHRQLADTNPGALLPDLAASLNNLATILSGVGRRQDALGAITEAVSIRRRLADANPGAFRPDLAASLNNLAARLSEASRHHDALDAITEAVAHYRKLAGANPGAFLPDLGTSLNSLANGLSEIGRRQDALDAITEAVAHHRQLADANPDAFLPGLAVSLNNRATRLTEVGRLQDALDAVTEAVAIRRQLADANPGALPDLATSLNNLAAMLSGVGCSEDALVVVTEAVAIRRQLADADPGDFLPDLARSLNNQTNVLSELDRRHDALDAITEAVSIHRQLADADPGAFLPHLARSLNDQANVLSELGRSQGAIESWRTAITAQAAHPGHQAHLLALRAAWLASIGDAEGALEDLLAVVAVSPSEDPTEREALGAARRAARDVAQRLPANLLSRLPTWTTAPINEEAAAFIGQWAGVAGTNDEEAHLRAHGDLLTSQRTREALQVLSQLHLADPFLRRAKAVLRQVGTVGPECALDALAGRNRLLLALRDWIVAPGWAESRAGLEANRELLLSDAAEAVLKHDDQPAAVQHLGILRLARERGIAKAYEIVTDVAEAADQIADAIEHGSADRLRALVAACPALLERRFVGAAALGVLALLTGQREDAHRLLATAAGEATDTQRRAFMARLGRLAGARPEYAAAIADLTALLQR